jgi:glutamyl-tRNA synthetase
MASVFDIRRVSPNPARFDLKKCTAINADWIRSLAPSDLTERIVPFLRSAGLVGENLTDEQRQVLAISVPLVQERMETLDQAPGMLGFLFAGETFAVDDADAAAVLTSEAMPALEASITALESLGSWTAADIEGALRAALVEGLGLKPKVAFGPVRVAVTGRRVSPPLFESLEILGPDVTVARLRRARG